MILACLQHPVRSIVLPMHDSDAAVQITTALKRKLHEIVSPDSVWWQEEHLMHAPLVHATVQEVRADNNTPTTPTAAGAAAAQQHSVAAQASLAHATNTRMQQQECTHKAIPQLCFPSLRLSAHCQHREPAHDIIS